MASPSSKSPVSRHKNIHHFLRKHALLGVFPNGLVPATLPRAPSFRRSDRWFSYFPFGPPGLIGPSFLPLCRQLLDTGLLVLTLLKPVLLRLLYGLPFRRQPPNFGAFQGAPLVCSFSHSSARSPRTKVPCCCFLSAITCVSITLKSMPPAPTFFLKVTAASAST